MYLVVFYQQTWEILGRRHFEASWEMEKGDRTEWIINYSINFYEIQIIVELKMVFHQSIGSKAFHCNETGNRGII